MSCVAPLTGINCSQTYASAAGRLSFWIYRLTFLIPGIILAVLSLLELRQHSTLTSRHPLQQHNQKSLYIRLLAVSLVFCVSSVDPLGYDNVIGVDQWLIVSGISTFLVLSVCLSLIFFVVRNIALVGSKHGSLSSFNSLYMLSQISIAITWVCLPVVQALVNHSYIVEAVKLICSSIVFLTWTVGSLHYGVSAVVALKDTVSEKHKSSANLSSSVETSGVYSQRLYLLSKYNKLLVTWSVLSVIFVCVQAIDAVHAIRTQQDVNFDIESSVPTNFADLFCSGLFETLKLVFCFVVLVGMRVSRTPLSESTDPAEEVALSEIAGKMDEKANEVEDSEGSQTAMLNAAA